MRLLIRFLGFLAAALSFGLGLLCGLTVLLRLLPLLRFLLSPFRGSLSFSLGLGFAFLHGATFGVHSLLLAAADS